MGKWPEKVWQIRIRSVMHIQISTFSIDESLFMIESSFPSWYREGDIFKMETFFINAFPLDNCVVTLLGVGDAEALILEKL